MIRKLAHPAVLSVAGLGFLSAAAWTVGTTLGLAAVGVSLLLLEFRLDKS
jgi:mannose/fructose/N-acetylgalactosamine-specific phosphotransferase system component IIC